MQTKLVKKLHDKKHRQETGLFLVEGEKSVIELLASDFEIVEIYVSADTFNTHKKAIEKSRVACYTIDAAEIASLSTLENNYSALALVKQKPMPKLGDVTGGITLMLDGIRDPGNLGTLIRIADWYGIERVIASPDTTDFYNPKTIAASMGSFTRVQCIYADLPAALRNHFQKAPVFIADSAGTPTDEMKFPSSGVLVVGSESHGASQAVRSSATALVAIRRYGKAESLNAAVAGAVILDRWRGQA